MPLLRWHPWSWGAEESFAWRHRLSPLCNARSRQHWRFARISEQRKSIEYCAWIAAASRKMIVLSAGQKAACWTQREPNRYPMWTGDRESGRTKWDRAGGEGGRTWIKSVRTQRRKRHLWLTLYRVTRLSGSSVSFVGSFSCENLKNGAERSYSVRIKDLFSVWVTCGAELKLCSSVVMFEEMWQTATNLAKRSLFDKESNSQEKISLILEWLNKVSGIKRVKSAKWG